MKRLAIFTLVICCLLVLAGCATAPTVPPSSPITESPTAPSAESGLMAEAFVARVIDGDTIEVDLGGRLYKVRYIGIDTPETVHPTRGVEPYGMEASAKNKELVEGKVVLLEKDVSETDKYDRLLRYVWLGDLFVNAELVRLGYAQVTTYPPDVKYQEEFLRLQRQAIEEGRGLWGLTEETETTAPPAGKFVGSINSDVYHYPTCTYAQRIYLENLIQFDSPEDATAQGYRPCKVCRPP